MKTFLLVMILLVSSCSTRVHYIHKNKAALFGGIDGYIINRAAAYQDSCKVVGMKGQYFEVRCK